MKRPKQITSFIASADPTALAIIVGLILIVAFYSFQNYVQLNVFAGPNASQKLEQEGFKNISVVTYLPDSNDCVSYPNHPDAHTYVTSADYYGRHYERIVVCSEFNGRNIRSPYIRGSFVGANGEHPVQFGY